MIWSNLLPILAYACTADATPTAASRRADDSPPADPNVKITVDASVRFQEMDGLGVSEAFQTAYDVFGRKGLSPKNQSQVLDLLFSLEKGAGFTILRNGLGTSDNQLYGRMQTILPVSPGSPYAQPNYVWDGNSTGQVPLAQEATKRGLQHLFGSAWSAPGFMKTTNDDLGGYLCGVNGTNCATGNWIQPYVNFLLQYVNFYKQSGLKMTELGFLNEPEIKTTYVSMLSDGTQAAEVLRVLGPAVKKAGLDVKVTCCDTLGWKDQQNKMAALKAGPDPAESHVDIITAHGYGSDPNFPLNTTQKVWQTEWCDQANKYTPYTFYEKGEFGEGLTWADNIQTAFVRGNVSAFLYWIGAANSTSNSCLINLRGDEIITTKRYWAHAQFSKFARPGARRISASSDNSDVTVSSFLNTDGKIATQIINRHNTSVQLDFSTKGPLAGAEIVVPYVTSNDHDLKQLDTIAVSGGRFQARVPAKSLVSFVTSPKPQQV
ncbi:hypothetical protein E4U53_006472 [Claviceps sorghi]|nr:hypothetical protein E4U53_006472 [Claviceps sorghi]